MRNIAIVFLGIILVCLSIDCNAYAENIYKQKVIQKCTIEMKDGKIFISHITAMGETQTNEFLRVKYSPTIKTLGNAGDNGEVYVFFPRGKHDSRPVDGRYYSTTWKEVEKLF